MDSNEQQRNFLDTVERHSRALEQFKNSAAPVIVQFSNTIFHTLRQGGCLYLCGNGGSAADCQHIAGEFLGRFRRERRALPAIALSADTSVITCIGNDYSFDEVFSRQVEALAGKNDLLWAFSTSGESRNIIRAAEAAAHKGAGIISFTGRTGSTLEGLSDINLCIDTEWTSTAQEIHLLAYHMICDLVELRYMEEYGQDK